MTEKFGGYPITLNYYSTIDISVTFHVVTKNEVVVAESLVWPTKYV